MKELLPGRSTKIESFLLVAQQMARLSTCRSRRVGCVLTDEYGRVCGTGFNGVASKTEHVCEKRCQREDCKPGEKLNLCLAIHAEANALMHCTDIKRATTCYVWGASPCFECAKLLCNSGVKQVFSSALYEANNDERVMQLFSQRGIHLTIINFVDENITNRVNEPAYRYTVRDIPWVAPRKHA